MPDLDNASGIDYSTLKRNIGGSVIKGKRT